MVKKRPAIFSREIDKFCQNLSINTNGKAIIYARISSKNQESGFSIESQIQACKEYCIDRNFELINVVSETKSAKIIKNQRLLFDISKNNENINLIIFEASRLSRNLTDCINFLELCKEKNITIHFVEKKLISSSANDLKLIISDIIDSETEIKNLSIRVKRSIRYKKINNLYLPSVPRYGKMCCNKKMYEIPDELKVINLIKKLFNGGTTHEIENMLINITGNPNHKLYYWNNPDKYFDRVERGNLRKKDIAEFLNYVKILRRNKLWTSRMISQILA